MKPDRDSYHRVMQLGKRRCLTVLAAGNMVPSADDLDNKRLLALLAFAYALGVDDTTDAIAKSIVKDHKTRAKKSSSPNGPNVVPFARRPRGDPRPL